MLELAISSSQARNYNQANLLKDTLLVNPVPLTVFDRVNLLAR